MSSVSYYASTMQRWHMISLSSVLVLLVLFPRVLDLDAFRSPDEDRWMANTAGFTRQLAYGQLDQLIQLPHPGITTQWLGALAIRSEDWAVRKVPLVLIQSILILGAGYIFGRLWGRGAGIFTVLTLAADPLLYAHTRVFAMDSLLALFSVLALGLLLLWRQEKNQSYAARYLLASAFCTAAAILSKLPGVALLPMTASAFAYWGWQTRNSEMWRQEFRHSGLWIVAFLMSLALILPSFAMAPANVIGDFMEFFRSDDYQELHQLGPYYYLGSLLFFSTPLQWLTLAVLGWLATKRHLSHLEQEQMLILLAFALLLVVQMTIGAKKGDRYILPSFLMLDIVAAWTIAKMHVFSKSVVSSKYHVSSIRPYLLHATYYLLLVTLAWQFIIIWHTHPHTLAYINPLTKPWFAERRHGWGEGLDLAAQYLNQKPDAASLKAATFYPAEFAPYFVGEAVPVHQHDNSDVDYVVIYRAMFGRGAEAWETDVVNQYRAQTPEHIISFQGVPFAWLYATATNTETSPE